MKTVLNDLALSQIEKRLSSIREMKEKSSISGSWIKYIRKALGLTLCKLSKRVGLSKSTVAQIEKREVEGRVTLSTLRKVATAMDCEFIYAFVPNESVKETIYKNAREKARQRLMEADLHMKLEDQAVDGDMEERIERLALNFINNGDVW